MVTAGLNIIFTFIYLLLLYLFIKAQILNIEKITK